MTETTLPTGNTSTTTHKVVVPFYIYAGLSLFVATILLAFSTDAFSQHHFHPRTLAITHLMALGWGTMVILGASHQLVPVLIGSDLYSIRLAYFSFGSAAVGIPLVAWSFFHLRFDFFAILGGTLVNVAIVCYLINLFVSISKSRSENVHAVFIFTAAGWLMTTCLMGLLLMINFRSSILPADSLHYLSLHAHLGIVGWFLMMVLGVGSRLIPMFLISKYQNNRSLWLVFAGVNIGLALFILVFITGVALWLYLLPALCILTSIILFVAFCRKSYQQRIRKSLDEPMRISMASVFMMVIPLLLVMVLVASLIAGTESRSLVMAYGFTIFFGWLSAIIFGMTFKTLPFIVWTMQYQGRAGREKIPQPKDLYSSRVFDTMIATYAGGFIIFLLAVVFQIGWALTIGSILLLLSAILYNGNVFKMIFHKAK